MTHVRVVALSIALFAATPAFSQTSIAGDWDFTVNSPQGSNTTLVTLKQDGEKVSGIFKSQRGELPFDGGVLAGNELKFTFTINTQGMQLPITLTGKVEGESMSGKADFGGFAEGDWTAKRSTGATAAAAAPATTTAPARAGGLVTGQWEVTFKTPAGDRPATANVTEANGKLTGTVVSEAGEVPLNGTIDGKAVKIEFTAQTPQGSMNVTMTGDIENDAVANGKAEIVGLGVLEWTAKRKQ